MGQVALSIELKPQRLMSRRRAKWCWKEHPEVGVCWTCRWAVGSKSPSPERESSSASVRARVLAKARSRVLLKAPYLSDLGGLQRMASALPAVELRRQTIVKLNCPEPEQSPWSWIGTQPWQTILSAWQSRIQVAWERLLERKEWTDLLHWESE